MSDLLRTLDRADKLVGFYREGKLVSVILEDELIDLGFYAIEIEPRRVVAWLDGIRFEMNGTANLLEAV